jgi:GNAT superfamily N-acetyltransferase
MGIFARAHSALAYKSSDVRLRQMDFDDLPTVAAIECQSFDEHWRVGELHNLLLNSHIGWVIHIRGRIEGYGLAVPVGKIFFLDRLAVDCHSRGEGYGESLVEYAKYYAVRVAECNRIIVPVGLRDWEVAEFFAAQGFVGAECYADRDGVDWIHFVWRKGWE